MPRAHRSPFDAHALARHALAEADAFLTSLSGFEDASHRDVFIARRKDAWPLPPEAPLAHVLEEAFYTSLATEEGRPCKLRLLYDGGLRDARSEASVSNIVVNHWLERDLPFDRDTLRHLCPVHDPHRGALFWRDDGDHAFIVGIAAVPPRLAGSNRLEFTISAPRPAHVIIGYEDHALVAHRSGELFLRSQCALPDLGDLSRFLGPDFAHAAKILPRAAISIFDQGHGGALWIAAEARPRGVRFDYPLSPTPVVAEGAVDPELERAALESVGKLATTDGAVVIDAAGRLLGFGAFCDPRGPLEADVLQPEGRSARVSVASLGGGRHRAAAAFCHENAPAAALVVSTDGKITVMKCERASPVRAAEVGPFGREAGF